MIWGAPVGPRKLTEGVEVMVSVGRAFAEEFMADESAVVAVTGALADSFARCTE